MEKYLTLFLAVAAVVYCVGWLLQLPRRRVQRNLFETDYPEYSDIPELSDTQLLEWEKSLSKACSSPIYSVLDVTFVLLHYPNVLLHSVILGKAEFGGVSMLLTSTIVWWMIASLFI